MRGRECVVAILLPRRNERVFVAQLAAMKAGAAYLCIDPIIPDERIKFMFSDSTPCAVITDQNLSSRLVSDGNHTPLIVYEDWENADQGEEEM